MIRKVFSFQSDVKDFSAQENILVLSFSEKGFLLITVSENEIMNVDDFVFEPAGADINRFDNEFMAFMSEYGLEKISFNKKLALVNAVSYLPVPMNLKQDNKNEKLASFVSNNERFMSETENLGGERNPFFLMYHHHQWQDVFLNNLHWDMQKRTDIAHFSHSILNNLPAEDGVFVKVNNSCFDVLVVSESRLKLINRFPFATSKDFCYYLLGALKSAGLDTFGQTVYLAGDILPGSEIVQLLSKYVSQIKYLAPHGINVPANFPLHRYFTQLSGL